MSISKNLTKKQIDEVTKEFRNKPLFVVQKLLFDENGRFEFANEIEIFISKKDYHNLTGNKFIEGKPLRAHNENWGIIGFSFTGKKRQHEILKTANQWGSFTRFYQRFKENNK